MLMTSPAKNRFPRPTKQPHVVHAGNRLRVALFQTLARLRRRQYRHKGWSLPESFSAKARSHMKFLRNTLVGMVALGVSGLLLAQNYAPPEPNTPDEATLKAIGAKGEKLGQRLQMLRRQGVRDPQLADVEIYYKAAVWITRHNEFYHKDAAAWTQEALDRRLLRASQ